VNGTGCCQAARTRGLSAGEPGAASEGAGPAVEGVTARSSHVPGGAPLPGVSEDTLRLGSVVSRIQGGRGGVAGPGIPDAFARAVDGVRSAVLRPEVVVEEVPAPTRLAPSALALSGEVYPTRSLDEEPTATGRFVLLHDPSAPEPWEGVWRVVTYAKAAMEPELGHDPMLGQVGWSWLTEALESHGLAFAAEAGAVTCVLSESFGALSDRDQTVEMEIRASWTPLEDGIAEHFRAWGDLLCTIAGLPPLPEGVVALPGPRR